MTSFDWIEAALLFLPLGVWFVFAGSSLWNSHQQSRTLARKREEYGY